MHLQSGVLVKTSKFKVQSKNQIFLGKITKRDVQLKKLGQLVCRPLNIKQLRCGNLLYVIKFACLMAFQDNDYRGHE